jgi:hypothetical protein
MSRSDRHPGRLPPVPPAVITEVGESYLHAPSAPSDPLVVAAYEQLQTETDRLFDDLAGTDDPRAVRVVFTRNRQPYRSDDELIAAVRASRVLEVTTAAVDSTPIHPLLGCEFGGAFDRFRALHDLVGHAGTGLGFAIQDEIAAWRVQDRRHDRGLARRALATEILAVNCAISILGHPPDQKAVLLEPALLARATVSVADAAWPTPI